MLPFGINELPHFQGGRSVVVRKIWRRRGVSPLRSRGSHTSTLLVIPLASKPSTMSHIPPNLAHSTGLCGEAYPHSSEASGGEDLDIEEPVSGWDCSTLHFHATLAGMLNATLIRNKVLEVGQPRE